MEAAAEACLDKFPASARHEYDKKCTRIPFPLSVVDVYLAPTAKVTVRSMVVAVIAVDRSRRGAGRERRHQWFHAGSADAVAVDFDADELKKVPLTFPRKACAICRWHASMSGYASRCRGARAPRHRFRHRGGRHARARRLIRSVLLGGQGVGTRPPVSGFTLSANMLRCEISWFYG